MECKGNETRWITPHGRNLSDTRGRVHVEPRDDVTLILIFEKIHYEDHGKWVCRSDADGSQRHFIMRVYGENFQNAIFLDLKINFVFQNP